jgi:hypothetical protein
MFIDGDKFHRASAVAVEEFHRGSRSARDRPFVAHLGKSLKDERDVLALSRQRLFVAIGTGLILPPLDQFMFFQMLQPI